MASHHDHANLIWQIADLLRATRHRIPHRHGNRQLKERRSALISAAVTGKIAIPASKA